MGRDDRAITDNGKEARFPFLDTDIQCYMREHVHSSYLADFEQLRGQGDKKLLRQLATEHF